MFKHDLTLMQSFVFYKARYLTGEKKRNTLSKRRKAHLFRLLNKNALTRKLLNHTDHHYHYKNEREDHVAESYYLSKITSEKDYDKTYNGVDLQRIEYTEVIEIDRFNQLHSGILAKLSKRFQGMKLGGDTKDLRSSRAEFDIMQTGRLIDLNFKKNRKKNNDLLSHVNIAYTKTKESYFILRLSVHPSDKFKDEFRKILEGQEAMLSERHYHRSADILFHKATFISHETFVSSLTALNMRSLVADLSNQLHTNVTRHLRGYFARVGGRMDPPRIEYYEFDDIEKAKKDRFWKNYFDTSYYGYHSLKDGGVHLYRKDRYREESNLFCLVKQKGHGARENHPNDASNYASIETHYLLRSLAFPCAFSAVLKEEYYQLLQLKRQVYDFAASSGASQGLKFSLLFSHNREYLRLKKHLTKIIVTTRRFENEFDKRSLSWLTHESNLSAFVPVQSDMYKQPDLLKQFLEDLTREMQSLHKKTAGLNEIFKTTEELNAYRTNLALQVASLIITILAFIFAFDKVRELFVR
jgi:hypothetical protein